MRRGFTLIELLVVIAIIAILAAILFPVFARAREKARQSTCMSNVKQITLSILQYAQDYDERFPFSYSTPPNTADRKGLIQITQPYIQNWQVHDCPSADVPSNMSYLGNRSYGYHTSLIPAAAAGVKLGEVLRPAEIVLMGDVCHDPNATVRLHLPSAGPFQCDPDGSNCRLCGRRHNSEFTNHGNWERPGFNFIERHQGTGNVGFVDGHAKAMKHMELYRNGSNAPYFNHNQ